MSDRPANPDLPLRTRLAKSAGPGLRAVRQNWRPFLALQATAAVIVGLYYLAPALRPLYDRAAAMRSNGGLPFVILSTMLAGAILPELAKSLLQPGWKLNRARLNEVFFLLGFFAVNGLLIDGFYNLLGIIVGQGTDLRTVLIKTLIDMSIFSPFIALPFVAFWFDWRRNGFRLWPALRPIVREGPRWWLRRVLPLQIPGWAYWGPMVLLIYALPLGLQFVLWLLAIAAWSLVMVFISTEPEDAPIPPIPPPE